MKVNFQTTNWCSIAGAACDMLGYKNGRIKSAENSATAGTLQQSENFCQNTEYYYCGVDRTVDCLHGFWHCERRLSDFL